MEEPPPQSLTLTAALYLQRPSKTVYLMDPDYLQNWLHWAVRQSVIPAEQGRVTDALTKAAFCVGLQPPQRTLDCHEPGPIDALSLAVPGHPLLLNPLVKEKKKDLTIVTTTTTTTISPKKPPLPKGAAAASQRSLSSSRFDRDDLLEASQQPKDDFVPCVAVPEAFYELLRSTHGVLCSDGYTVSFQAAQQPRWLLQHYPHGDTRIQPVEFRRKKIPQTSLDADDKTEPATLMEKLLLEDQEPHPTLEVHPIKLRYHYQNQTGVVLASRPTQMLDALTSLQQVAVPDKPSDCVRLWVPSATRRELVRLQPNRTLQEWLLHHSDTDEVTLYVETRKTAQDHWFEVELADRLQVGDFCDAQDVAGRWYEAVVRELGDDFVKVHYVGWSSRWDATVKRKDGLEPRGINVRLAAPAPLWSQTNRWQERMQVGDCVEVRDSSSLESKPKWYRGEIKKLGQESDPIRELVGGAELELYEVEPGVKKPLHLLGRRQQVLVEVEEEKVGKSGLIPASPGEGDLAAGLNPQPPFLRWVDLYGEEICELGTHLKKDENKGPATLDYVLDHHRKPVEVLKSGLPNLGAGFMRESLRGNPPAPGSVGLHNLGNSCFLNSTLQCMNHITPLTQYFVTDVYLKDLNKRNPLGSGGNVAMAYASLLKKIWSGEYSTLAPRMLKQTVAAFAPQFDNSYQHDSQEFCQFLMDGLHEDLNRVENKPYVEELEGFGMQDDIAAIESWRKHLLRHDSVIVDHCQGMHRSHLTCPRCGRESVKFDIYSSISLPLVASKKQRTIPLEDCLEKFMEGEQLDERNAWYCPKCRQHVCALKMIALWSVPDVLILQLKRFTFDTCMSSGGMLRSKMDHKVEFPVEKLDLTKHILGPIDPDSPPVYKLFGVSEHTGPTANSGHYTATVRNSVDDSWYRCNDSHVGRTSGEASVTGGAYLLFYQRAKGLSRWAGMEKVMKERSIDPYGGLEKDLDGFTKVKSKNNKPMR